MKKRFKKKEVANKTFVHSKFWVFLSVPKVTESNKKKQVSSFFIFLHFSYFWINSPLAGIESAQADPVPAVTPLNTVHCQLYTCAGATRDEYFQLRNTRDEYFQLRNTRDEYFHQPWWPMLQHRKPCGDQPLFMYSLIVSSYEV